MTLHFKWSVIWFWMYFFLSIVGSYDALRPRSTEKINKKTPQNNFSQQDFSVENNFWILKKILPFFSSTRRSSYWKGQTLLWGHGRGHQSTKRMSICCHSLSKSLWHSCRCQRDHCIGWTKIFVKFYELAIWQCMAGNA